MDSWSIYAPSHNFSLLEIITIQGRIILLRFFADHLALLKTPL